MSLQVWLPLNGNLNNQGLADVTITNNGATINNEGKIGKCYFFDGTFLSFPNPLKNPCSEFSIAAWVNLTEGYAKNNGLHICSWNGTYSRICISKDGAAVRVLLPSNKGFSSTALDTSITANVWNHYAITFKNQQLNIYINGILDKSINTELTEVTFASNTIFIGTYSSELSKGKVNDFRVYDHCLSSKEVKEISKGLVLHYKLDGKYETTTNLASSSVGGWNNSGNCTRLTNDTSLDSSKPTRSNVTSVKITTAGNCALTCGTTSTNLPSKTLTFSIWCYLSGPQENNTIYIRSTKTDGNVGNFEYNGSTNPSTWPLNQWLYLTKTITTASDATTFYFCTYANALDRYVALNGWQIEEKDHASPYTEPGTTRTAIEHDCSGYGNNGTISGILTSSSDSFRYRTSTYMPKAALITHSNPISSVATEQEWSCAMWVKLDNTAQANQYMNNFNSGNHIVYAANSTPLLYLNSGTDDYYNYGNQAVLANVWTHIVFVFKNSNATKLIYINGVNHTNTNGPNKTSTPSGIPNTVTVGTNLAGYISDYRIYATALSANDVLELYQTSASIGKDGSVYAYELEEV